MLNPILAEKEATAQRLARELGYRSYVELSEESRRAQLRPFMVEGKRFLRRHRRDVYRSCSGGRPRELGIPRRAAPPERLQPAVQGAAPTSASSPRTSPCPPSGAFLGGMGIDFKTVAGTEVRVDDALNPLKEPRAACWGIRVPSDVRINVKPLPGLDSLGVFFHEGGHAVHVRQHHHQGLGVPAARPRRAHRGARRDVPLRVGGSGVAAPVPELRPGAQRARRSGTTRS